MPKATITERFRAQHNDIEQRICDVEAQLRNSNWRENITALRAEFTQLSAKLRIHLALEDNALYPRLSTHSNSDLSALAHQYQLEMGDIRDRYEDFITEWLHGERLSREPKEFERSSALLFSTLRNRLERENTELYPLADTVG
ncbi:MAG: hemerythrin domain-containing protein [Elstera sp.]